MLGLNAVWTQGPTAATQGRLRLCSGHSQKVLDGRLEVIVSCISCLLAHRMGSELRGERILTHAGDTACQI